MAFVPDMEETGEEVDDDPTPEQIALLDEVAAALLRDRRHPIAFGLSNDESDEPDT